MTRQGDSIKCFVEVALSYGSKIGYKKGVNDPETFIPTKDIKFILTTGRYLENIALGKRELLMTMVADGRVRLFLQVVSLNYMFVVKKGSIYTEVPRKNYRQVLSALLYECPEVVQKLREKVFAYEQMDLVVTEYNSCQ